MIEHSIVDLCIAELGPIYGCFLAIFFSEKLKCNKPLGINTHGHK